MNCYCYFPDNAKDKDVMLQAAGHEPCGGSRHVLLFWQNGVFEHAGGRKSLVHQIIQLATKAGGSYTYEWPLAEMRPEASMVNNATFVLGTFTRAQRNCMLQMAGDLPFEKQSKVNGCQVWTRELLEAMVTQGFISRDTFDEIDEVVPLIQRRPEMP